MPRWTKNRFLSSQLGVKPLAHLVHIRKAVGDAYETDAIVITANGIVIITSSLRGFRSELIPWAFIQNVSWQYEYPEDEQSSTVRITIFIIGKNRNLELSYKLDNGKMTGLDRELRMFFITYSRAMQEAHKGTNGT